MDLSADWPPSRVGVGDWLMFFDAAAEVLAVRDSPSFRARQLMLKTMDGRLHTTLVPVDYEPVPITWAVTSTVPGLAARR